MCIADTQRTLPHRNPGKMEGRLFTLQKSGKPQVMISLKELKELSGAEYNWRNKRKSKFSIQTGSLTYKFRAFHA